MHQIAVTRIGRIYLTGSRWRVHWEEVNNPHGDTNSGYWACTAQDELGALLEFKKWVAGSNRGWEVVP